MASLGRTNGTGRGEPAIAPMRASRRCLEGPTESSCRFGQALGIGAGHGAASEGLVEGGEASPLAIRRSFQGYARGPADEAGPGACVASTASFFGAALLRPEKRSIGP